MLSVTATDNGQTSAPTTASFFLDNAVPGLSFTRVTNGAGVSGVQVTVTDPAPSCGIAEVWFTATNLDYISLSVPRDEGDGSTYAGFVNRTSGFSFTIYTLNASQGASITVTVTDNAAIATNHRSRSAARGYMTSTAPTRSMCRWMLTRLAR